MCFVPKISLTTAIFEFLVAAWSYYHYPKNKLINFFVSTLVLLGLYQFTEYMLCTSNNIQLWGKIGFIIYTVIPANMVFCLSQLGKKQKINYLLFLPSLIFVIYALIDTEFILYGTCSTLFVSIANKFTSYNYNMINALVYQEYYFFYIAIIAIHLIRRIKKHKNKEEVITSVLIIITSLFIIIPLLILIIILPSISIKFASIYCQFVMLFTLTALIGLYLENKIKN